MGCNNMFIFPGLGLGVTVCGAEMVTDRMLYVAAEALANHISDEELQSGKVFPNVNTIRDVSHKVACAVVREAARTNQAHKSDAKNLDDLESFVSNKMYDPVYVPLVEKRELKI